MICEGWIDDFFLDFHLMVNEPDRLFDVLADSIPRVKRKKCLVTLHREAYRRYPSPEDQSIGRFASKENDLRVVIRTLRKNSEMYAKLENAQLNSENMLKTALDVLKESGYATGIAAEPNTSDISKDLVAFADLILVMSVHSGRGGQTFMPSALKKIEMVRRSCPDKYIQVDGGIDADNIGTVIEAGADNIVVGSYITEDRDPVARFKELQEIISGYNLGRMLSGR
jgi:ribulose-phosphate 3-epimerase